MTPRTVAYLMDSQGNRAFGPGPYRLLAAVHTEGSLAAAARFLGMSYTKALHILRRAEAGAATPLLVRRTGGEAGGSSTLTEAGETLLARYHLWSDAVAAEGARLKGIAFAGLDETPRLGCVVMASGQARRFGRQKLLEPLGGKPMLEHTLDALADARLETVVVTRSRAVVALCGGRGAWCVIHGGAFQSDTVREGMRALGRRTGYLFVVGDQPLLARQSVARMLDEHAHHPDAIIRLSWQGEAGSPVLFPGWLSPALSALSGDCGGLALLRENPVLCHLVRTVEAASPEELWDIDTPEGLARVDAVCGGDAACGSGTGSRLQGDE